MKCHTCSLHQVAGSSLSALPTKRVNSGQVGSLGTLGILTRQVTVGFCQLCPVMYSPARYRATANDQPGLQKEVMRDPSNGMRTAISVPAVWVVIYNQKVVTRQVCTVPLASSSQEWISPALPRSFQSTLVNLSSLIGLAASFKLASRLPFLPYGYVPDPTMYVLRSALSRRNAATTRNG